MAGEAAAGGPTAAGVQAGAEAVNAGSNIIKGRHKQQTEDNVRRDEDAQKTDRLNRQEASRRFDREMLQNALSSYYQKQGWKMPDPSSQLPGYGTTRKLPFENDLYSGDQSPWSKEPQAANKQPGKPVFQDPAMATDGTDGTTTDQAQSAVNPNSQNSGEARNDAPTQNDQQKAAASLDGLFDKNPKKIYDWSKAKPL